MSDLETLRAELRARADADAVPLMLPALAYTSPEVLAWELRHLYAGTWTCLGRLDELLPDGITQRSVRVGDVGALLTRSEDRLRMFANTCRHRGHELLAPDAASEKRSIVWPLPRLVLRPGRPRGRCSGLPRRRRVRAFRPRAGGAAGDHVERLGLRPWPAAARSW